MFIYLASPYSHADHNVMEERYIRNLEVVQRIAKLGDTPYSPIVHFHQVAKIHGMRTDFHFWQKHNENMLRVAKELIILTLPGWDISRGVNFELGFARAARLHVAYMHPVTFELSDSPQA